MWFSVEKFEHISYLSLPSTCCVGTVQLGELLTLQCCGETVGRGVVMYGDSLCKHNTHATYITLLIYGIKFIPESKFL
jgi:hypothetical protein